MEEATKSIGASRTRTAVEDDGGFTAGVAAALPIQPMPISDIQVPLVVRLDFPIK
jgi:hypothetical protein